MAPDASRRQSHHAVPPILRLPLRMGATHISNALAYGTTHLALRIWPAIHGWHQLGRHSALSQNPLWWEQGICD